jgi:prepilin-type N-terminal cleavage/methylation domain-containing protein
MKRRAEDGFTLTEILIAVLLLSTVLAFLLSAFVSAFRWLAPQPAVSALLARQKLEDLYEHVREDWWRLGTSELSPGTYPNETVTLDGIDYVRFHTVSQPGGKQYRKASVVVQWPE